METIRYYARTIRDIVVFVPMVIFAIVLIAIAGNDLEWEDPYA